MAARSIASLTLSFGLVSIPVKLYTATESSGTIRFNLLTKDGQRVRQQYVSARDERVVDRSEMVKGYEFEKDRFVTFSPDELKALQESPSHVIDIVAFIPEKAVDPIYYDKAYYLAPDKRGAKPYSLLVKAMRESGRCALAKWAWKGKQYVVQVRPLEDGLVLQQLLYADEVRSLEDLDIEKVPVTDAELKLALQLIEQIAADRYDPKEFEDEEKKRVLAAIDEKIAGKQIVVHEEEEPAAGAQVIDLMQALRASLGGKSAPRAKEPAGQGAEPGASPAARARKSPRRAAGQEEQPAARARARSKK
ncbi:MAG: Ku protein [Burkholderiaceae bacterium]|nr:Ku protein [Burkholderiaceae bacterium]